MSVTKRWRLGVLLLALLAVGTAAFAGRPALAKASAETAAARPRPETAEIAALYAQSQRLAAETDRMTLGVAQMRLNASAGATPLR